VEGIGKFLDQGGDAVALPRAIFEKNRELLPANLTVIAEASRIFRKNQNVVVITKSNEVARGPSREQAR
jgi:hypothetical protein